MSLLFNLLITAALIAGMIALRVFADRSALRFRIKGAPECQRGCEPNSAASSTSCDDRDKA